MTLLYPKISPARGLALFVIGSLLAIIPAKAQIKDSCVFLKGNYLEVGVNINGAYGTRVDAPAGYHPRADVFPGSAMGRLGFVADPAKDGWADSTAPARAYYGDMFLPGTPQEGWSLLMESTQVNCWNMILGGALPAGVSGRNTKLVTAGSRIAATWEGTYDSLSIEQRTVIDTARTYMILRVKIRNLAHRDRTNMHYLRTVDPDNDVTITPGFSGFVTRNKVDLQLPNVKKATMISAKGNTYEDAYLSMSSKDPRAKCFMNKINLSPEHRLDTLYAEDTANYIYGAGDTLTNDAAISMVFKIDTLRALDSTTIVMAYMFRPDDLDSALADDGRMPGDPEPTSLSGNPRMASLQVAPNPFTDQLLIKELKAGDKVVLYDLNGKALKQGWTITTGGDQVFDTAEIPQGIYLLQVQDASGAVKARIRVQRR